MDQFFYSVRTDLPCIVDFKHESLDTVEVYYVSSHGALAEWMIDLYVAKGGTKAMGPVQLTCEDLGNLFRDIACDDSLFATRRIELLFAVLKCIVEIEEQNCHVFYVH